MRNPFVYGVGGVLSADIAVPDHKRELAFYSTILTTGNAPLWRDDLMNNLGTPVIGLGARTPEYDTLPLQWMPHFQVADVSESVARTVELGGEELFHSKTEDGQSQWAVLVDQVGAAFGVIPVEAGEMQNARCGQISWISLVTPDALSSRDFYQQVVGWKAKSIETQSIKNKDSQGQLAAFEMHIDNNTVAAEICEFHSGLNGVPPVWLLHLPVYDLPESLRLVRAHGGEVIKEFAKEKYAVICDPVGAYFALRSG